MKIKEFDTIAAVATSFSEASIGIIRISGEKAFSIANEIFSPINLKKQDKKIEEYETHSLTYGNIKHGDEIIDEVLIAVMKAPNTYTCEDVIEINCHGGKSSIKRILNLVLESGARLAENGEFTKRAFLNGRIDLSQAEAVIDIINSKNELSHKAAVKRLEGGLKNKITKYRNEVLTMIAHIEASIDYPEHDDETMTYNSIKTKTQKLIKDLEILLKNSENGRIIKEGINTVILGKPNVGKSSILNSLLKEDRAIVSDIEGTTRDVLKENLNINGISLNIVDTAGIRETENEIEKIGIKKSKEYAKNADLVLLVLDNSKTLDEKDIELLKFAKNIKLIALINKIDLPSKIDKDLLKEYIEERSILEISARKNKGFNNLNKKIEDLFFENEINIKEDTLISNERNKNSLKNAIKTLENVLETIENSMPEDFISIDLIEAYKYLGEITGESLEEDIIDKIFSEFCLGK